VETARSGWTHGERWSAMPPLPGAPDPIAVPRPRERGGESPGRGAHRRIDGGDEEEEE
jgi:hypothetical protein